MHSWCIFWNSIWLIPDCNIELFNFFSYMYVIKLSKNSFEMSFIQILTGKKKIQLFRPLQVKLKNHKMSFHRFRTCKIHYRLNESFIASKVRRDHYSVIKFKFLKSTFQLLIKFVPSCSQKSTTKISLLMGFFPQKFN